MENARDRGTDTEGSCELIELHLFHADASAHDLTTVHEYLERRRHDLSLPTVCNRCKVSAISFARMRGSALEAEGMNDEAETYRWLGDTLTRETDPGLSSDWTG